MSENSLQVEVVPYYNDNYCYLVHCNKTNLTAAFDCGDAEALLKSLRKHRWKVDYIFVTHHHYDHAMGVREILRNFPSAKFYKPSGETRILDPGIDIEDGDIIPFGEYEIKAFKVNAHTKFCTAYAVADHIFTGDALFSGGCGRLFEGEPEDLERAMNRFSAYPDETKVWFGHEYTVTNLRFAQTVDSDNEEIESYLKESVKKVAQREFTTPTTIAREKRINPFLKAQKGPVVHSIDPRETMSVSERLALLRKRKDMF